MNHNMDSFTAYQWDETFIGRSHRARTVPPTPPIGTATTTAPTMQPLQDEAYLSRRRHRSETATTSGGTPAVMPAVDSSQLD